MTIKGRVVGGAWMVGDNKLDPVIADKGDPGADGEHGTDGIDGVFSVKRKSLTTNAAGLVTWNFGTPFAALPLIAAIVIDPSGGNDAYTIKVTELTVDSVSFRVSRSQITTVALLSLTILSIPSTVGAITFHAVAIPPE